MTFGIDVSGYQVGMDFALARKQGVEFCIVKAAGFNTGTLYSADGYHDHIDALLAAGMPGIGHYYVVGKGNPTTQAEFFVKNLYKFNVKYDVLALDNEPLDSNATHWDQDECWEFLSTVQSLTGIAWDRLWLYSPAAQTRANGPWTKITNTPIRIWWAAYGGQPTGHTPDHEPFLDGKIDRWDIHQYSSIVPVADRKTIDANYSPLSVQQLFGQAVTSVPATAPKPKPQPAKQPEHAAADWDFWLPSRAIQLRIQQALHARGRYDGKLDGWWGELSIKGIQLTIRNVGYTGKIDGIPGPMTCYYVQVYAQKFGDYKGPLDKKLGVYSWLGFALGLERP